jgi:hypothetical protein
MLVAFCALMGEMLHDSSIASDAKEMKRERAMATKEDTVMLNQDFKCQRRRTSIQILKRKEK